MPETLYCQMAHRALLAVRGADSLSFLQGILSNDMEKVEANSWLYALLLTPQGKFAFDFFITKTPEGFLLDCDRQTLPQLKEKLNFYKLRADVSCETDERSIYFSSAASPNLYPDPRTYPSLSPFGFRGVGEGKTDSTTLASLDLYHQARLTAGIPEAGIELTAARYPLECNLDALGAIDFHKGCFIGQEVVSRMKRRADGGRKRLVRLKGAGQLSVGEILTAGTGKQKVGEVLSTSGDLALALVRTDRLAHALLDQKINIEPLL